MSDLAAQYAAIKDRIAEAERRRIQAETRHQQAREGLAAIDTQIHALGVNPAQAEATLAEWEDRLTKELAVIDGALAKEAEAYRLLDGAK